MARFNSNIFAITCLLLTKQVIELKIVSVVNNIQLIYIQREIFDWRSGNHIMKTR